MKRYVVYNPENNLYLNSKNRGYKSYTVHLSKAHVFRRRSDALQSLRKSVSSNYNEQNFKILEIKLELAK